MKVIIIKPTKKIKKIGEIVQVKKGYARNYLLPKGIAIRATDENKNKFEDLKKELDIKYQTQHKDALIVIEKIKDSCITFISQSLDDGKLFGSISTRQIATELNKSFNTAIKAEQIHIRMPIKSVGVFSIEVELHHDATTNILVNVARSESETVTQLNNFKSEQAAEAIKAEEESKAPEKEKKAVKTEEDTAEAQEKALEIEN